jgi:transposase
VPAVINETSRKDREKVGERTARRRRASHVSGIIEVEIGGVTVRVGGGADAKTVAAVIPALKVIGLSVVCG